MGPDRAEAADRIRDSGHRTLSALHRGAEYFADSAAGEMAGGARARAGDRIARNRGAARGKHRESLSAAAFRRAETTSGGGASAGGGSSNSADGRAVWRAGSDDARGNPGRIQGPRESSEENDCPGDARGGRSAGAGDGERFDGSGGARGNLRAARIRACDRSDGQGVYGAT